MQFSCMDSFTSSLVKGSPLSLRTTCSIPCVEKILSNFGIMALADVDRTKSTSGNREYASMTTNKYTHQLEMDHKNPCGVYTKSVEAEGTSAHVGRPNDSQGHSLDKQHIYQSVSW